MTYSDQVYTIEISLSVNAQNRIVASACVDGQPAGQIEAAFANIYHADPLPPPTGDCASPALYAALLILGAGGMLLPGTKRNGRVRS